MKVALAQEMREIDRRAQEEYGLPALLLMERAALAVKDTLADRYGQLTGKKIFICCGKGNNGGDGLALARILLETGAKVIVVLLYAPEQHRGLAATNLQLAERFQVRTISWTEFNQTQFQEADLIIDAILGTGSAGAPTGVAAAAIEAINNSGRSVIAVDLPSGVNVDNGTVPGVAIRAALTVTFGVAKPGLLSYPGAEYTGDLIVSNIGFPKELLDSTNLTVNYLTASEAKTWLPVRKFTAHKGQTGQVAVLGGAPGMTGATALTALGALRSGCGLATIGLRPETPFPEKPVEVMVKSWPELAGRWSEFKSLVVGPGLTISPDGAKLLQEILATTTAPLVIDADGLNILAQNGPIPEFKTATVFTPHPGEMSRLTGLSVAEVQADRLEIARGYARKWGVTVVLKGARTVVAQPDGTAYLNLTGNPGMATAGMGDVLAGVIAGLIAQGMESGQAAVLGAFLHGWAGDLAATKKGPAGIIAGDVLEELPNVIKKVLAK